MLAKVLSTWVAKNGDEVMPKVTLFIRQSIRAPASSRRSGEYLDPQGKENFSEHLRDVSRHSNAMLSESDKDVGEWRVLARS